MSHAAKPLVALLAVACAAGCSGDAPTPTPAAQRRAAPAAPTATASGSADENAAFSYDPTNRRDPFRSFVRNVDEGEEAGSPLERFDLSQLELSAIVWGNETPRALVVDPSGKGYIVSTGTVLGKNKGRIISIGDNMVVVKETYVDSFDKATTKPVEMRLRNTEGG